MRRIHRAILVAIVAGATAGQAVAAPPKGDKAPSQRRTPSSPGLSVGPIGRTHTAGVIAVDLVPTLDAPSQVELGEDLYKVSVIVRNQGEAEAREYALALFLARGSTETKLTSKSGPPLATNAQKKHRFPVLSLGRNLPAGSYELCARVSGGAEEASQTRNNESCRRLQIGPGLSEAASRAQRAGNPNAITPSLDERQRRGLGIRDPSHFNCFGVTATILGTHRADTIQGTPGNDVIMGFGGNDVIHSGTGDDIICGGPGDDRLYGEGGNDYLYGEDGNDVLDGVQGNDSLRGGAGDDQLWGSFGTDHLWGESGNDALYGGAGTDRCDGGPGVDTTDTSCETRISIP